MKKILRKMKGKLDMCRLTINNTSPCLSLPSLAATLSGCTTDITVRFPSACKLKPNRLFHPRVSSTMNTCNNENRLRNIATFLITTYCNVRNNQATKRITKRLSNKLNFCILTRSLRKFIIKLKPRKIF